MENGTEVSGSDEDWSEGPGFTVYTMSIDCLMNLRLPGRLAAEGEKVNHMQFRQRQTHTDRERDNTLEILGRGNKRNRTKQAGEYCQS